jgi:hypothetical protein
MPKVVLATEQFAMPVPSAPVSRRNPAKATVQLREIEIIAHDLQQSLFRSEVDLVAEKCSMGADRLTKEFARLLKERGGKPRPKEPLYPA